jgi:hypothetical protein
MTTRKYPRSMQEAYSNTVEYGASIERPSNAISLADKVMYALTAVSVVLIFWIL